MTGFDALLIFIIGVSTLFAAIRGAIREIATLGALVAAGLAGWLSANPISAALGGKSFLVTIAIAGFIGLAAFIVCYVLAHKAMGRMKLSKKSKRIDRIGGGAFGVVRSLALIGLGFLGYGYYLDEANQPDSVRKAMLLPLASASAGFFEQFAPSNRDLRPADATKGNAAVEGYDGRDRSGLREIVTTATTNDETTPKSTSDPIADLLKKEATSDGQPER
ncbi:MAG: CvpA family protein [Parvularculaceae bacterium]|nr:CvpA family protein [Parvularculaceae bacterium]